MLLRTCKLPLKTECAFAAFVFSFVVSARPERAVECTDTKPSDLLPIVVQQLASLTVLSAFCAFDGGALQLCTQLCRNSSDIQWGSSFQMLSPMESLAMAVACGAKCKEDFTLRLVVHLVLIKLNNDVVSMLHLSAVSMSGETTGSSSAVTEDTKH